MFLDASLYDLSDKLECRSILLQFVMAEGNAVAGVCLVAMSLHAGVELITRLFIALLLSERGRSYGRVGRGGKKIIPEEDRRRVMGGREGGGTLMVR